MISLAKGGAHIQPPPLDLHAVSPELVLVAVICLVLLMDLALPDEHKNWIMPVSLAGVFATLVATLSLVGSSRATLGGMFVVDAFALLFKIVFTLAAALVLLMSYDYLNGDDIPKGEYYLLILSSLLGMLGIASSRDLVPIFISLELISLPAFILAGLRKRDIKSNEAALKFFLFGVLSTAIMLYGMSLIYGVTGTTNLAGIAAVLAATPPLREVSILSVFFIVVGFGFKVSAFPFQWWVPDTYEGSPVPVAAFLSVASKTAGFVGLLQVMFIAFIGLSDQWRPFIALLAIMTMTFGNLVALQQRHIIRLLAYSSIGQAGYILLPLAVLSPRNPDLNQNAFTASIVYLLIYAFMETGAFGAAVAYGKKTGGWFIEDYAGLFQRAPGIALAMTAFLFSLAGVPPFAGWAAKLFVFLAVTSSVKELGLATAWVLAGAMALNTVIALFYYAGVARQMFFEPPGELPRSIRVPPALGTAIALSVLVVVIVGVLPDLFGKLASLSTLL